MTLSKMSQVWRLLLFAGAFWVLVVLASGNASWVAIAGTTTAPGGTTLPADPPGGGAGPSGNVIPSAYGTANNNGGTGFLGISTVTFPPNVVPPGSTYTITMTDFPQSGLPIGTQGAAFRAPGDNSSGVLIRDQNGNLVRSFAAPGYTLCFGVSTAAMEQTPAGSRTIQYWNGNTWKTLPTAITGPTNGFYQMCTSITDPNLQAF